MGLGDKYFINHSADAFSQLANLRDCGNKCILMVKLELLSRQHWEVANEDFLFQIQQKCPSEDNPMAIRKIVEWR